MADIENPEDGVNETLNAVYNAAMEATAVGLCVIPPSEDGAKRPKPGLPKVRPSDPSPFLWDEYKTRLPTKEETRRWYPGRSGLGLVAGAVSGNIEPWDFDDRATYEAFVRAARAIGLGHVIDRIEVGYCDDTAGNGVRWLVRYPESARSAFSKDREILARRPKEPHEKKHEKDNTKILIEMTRFSILAPTNGKVHPSGKPYVRRSGVFGTIASYSVEERDALFNLARSFDAMPRRSAEPAPKASGKPAQGARPGDDYNARTTWAEVLLPFGWTAVYQQGGEIYWRRPGKDIGISATTNFKGSDVLKVFTTSTELDTEKTYTRFAFYTAMEHRGDFSAAAKALGKAGYGRDAVKGAADRAERRSAGEEEATPRADVDPVIEHVEYRDTGHRLEWLYRDRECPDGKWRPLTNFSAKIVGDVLQDDGVEQVRLIEIEARFGKRERRFKIPAAQFHAMSWPAEYLGAAAAVRPGQGTKDKARHAIQVLSGELDEQLVFAATGWTKVKVGKDSDAWVFMHGGGALGPDGPLPGIEVELPVELEGVVIPDEGGDTTKDVEASLEVLNVAPMRVTVPILGAVARAPLGNVDFGIHESGLTGAQKSEIAALAQQHFGPQMTARSLPCNWSSTANSLEASASSARDVVLVIDDFVPQGTSVDRARLNATADRVLRALGNRSGRGRLGADTRQRRARPPRGLIISTGEEVPAGQSLRARLVIVEVRRGDVILEKLTMAQKDAADGAYARAMAAYLKWLAPQLEKVQAEVRTIKDARRNMLPAKVHARTADAFAQLSAAWTIWLRFAVYAKAVTKEEAAALETTVWETLTGLALEQDALQRENDPIDRFFALLNALLSSGKAHIADLIDTGKPPKDNPMKWGWKLYGEVADAYWTSQGTCIGWYAADGIYLEPEVAYAQVQQFGGPSGEGVSVASSTLWSRMYDRKLILTTEKRGDERRFRARKVIGGKRRHIVHIAHNLAPYPTNTGPSGPSAPDGDNSDAEQ